MDKKTVEAYEGDAAAQRYIDRRDAYEPDRAIDFGRSVEGWRVDIGCGPGHYTKHLGAPLVSIDASASMLARVDSGARVRADLESLPFRRGALGGAWASKSYQHVPHEALPLALADLHRSLELAAPVVLNVFTGDGTRVTGDDDDFPGRLFSWWPRERLLDVVLGAGFEIEDVIELGRHIEVKATRARMLPDLVRPGLRVLFCGYNPSLYAADVGVPFARPGNRFWPAALAAGLVTRDRDPWHAVRHDDIGFTDMVKRASVAAAELTKSELRDGFARVTRVCEWLQPDVLCVLGIGGWRDLVDRKATVGWQAETVGGSRAYVMPNPSGLNASTQHDGYVEHLRRVTAWP